MDRISQETEGGARALALEPVREVASCGAPSRQTTLPAKRTGATKPAGSDEAPGAALAMKPQHSTQLASWSWYWPPSPLPVEDGLPWQISATPSGLEAAAAAAQDNPIGAMICTNKANKKTGRYFCSRARISVVPERGQLITRNGACPATPGRGCRSRDNGLETTASKQRKARLERVEHLSG